MTDRSPFEPPTDAEAPGLPAPTLPPPTATPTPQLPTLPTPANSPAPAAPTMPMAAPAGTPLPGPEPTEVPLTADATAGRSRRPIVLGALAAIVLLVGLIAVVARTSSDETADTTVEQTADDTTDTDLVRDPGGSDGSFSYGSAMVAQTESAAGRFEMEMQLGPTSLTMEGLIDRSERMSMTMRMPEDMGGGEMRTIVDSPGDRMYLGTDFMNSDFVTFADTEWVSVELSSALSMQGIDPDAWRDQLRTGADNAAAIADLEPELVGETTLDGERVVQYHVELSGDELRAAAAEAGMLDDATMAQFDVVGRAEYDIYVTEDNWMRRMDMTMELGGMEMTMVMRSYELEPDTVVEVPDPADVTELDLSDLGLGGF